MENLDLEARDFLEWWSENRSATFSLTEVAVKINEGRVFTDVQASHLRNFFDDNATVIETIGATSQRWAAL